MSQDDTDDAGEEEQPETVSLADSTRPEGMAVDWNPDYFPTSPKNIFIWAGVIFGGIILMSGLAYSCSPEVESKVKTKVVESKPKMEMVQGELDE